MARITKKEKSNGLYQAILTLKTEEEIYDFFQDLCTVTELRAMEQRFEVAVLLKRGMIYNDILERCPGLWPSVTGAIRPSLSVRRRKRRSSLRRSSRERLRGPGGGL